eukprot:11397738-Prorocentrum_lima.AAC.1
MDIQNWNSSSPATHLHPRHPWCEAQVPGFCWSATPSKIIEEVPGHGGQGRQQGDQPGAF